MTLKLEPESDQQIVHLTVDTVTADSDAIVSHKHNGSSSSNNNHQHSSAAAGSCNGCGHLIATRYYLQLGAASGGWHLDCLRCEACQFSLDAELSCYVKEGHVYCRQDYFRLFKPPKRCCGRCQEPLTASELVMRACGQVFHLDCFVCSDCSCALTPGEYFGMLENKVYCREHYNALCCSRNFAVALRLGEEDENKFDETEKILESGGLKVSRSRKSKLALCVKEELIYSMGEDSTMQHQQQQQQLSTTVAAAVAATTFENRGTDISASKVPTTGHLKLTNSQRQKRIRTSFKHHQLRSMKAYFTINHNPDAKDLKQLAQKTGLSKRVLQVWFQNARAKYRRSLQKQHSTGGGGGSLTNEFSESLAESLSVSDMDVGCALEALGTGSDSHSPALSDISSTPSMNDLQQLSPSNSSSNCQTLHQQMHSFHHTMNRQDFFHKACIAWEG